ncbi:MAG: hypothetical protein AB1444_15585 [Spirochaetota bacterium]
MKYSEIIELYDYFEPTYDITSEKKNYWKQFIPTPDFEDILLTFLDSLESNEPNLKKSIWIHGTYGVGKSHATGVIKHILFDPLEQIQDYIERIEKAQTRQRLLKFRDSNRVFPVVIKGLSGIYDTKTFVLAIERAVKTALINNCIAINVKSDFEKYIEYIKKENSLINWNNILNNKTKIQSYVSSIEDLITKLQSNNIEVLRLIEESLEDIALPFYKIEDWLEDVTTKLKKENYATALALYWDEYTSVLESPDGPSYLNILQNIAERTKDEDIYLFIISHKDPNQARSIDNKDIEKVLDRFHSKNYKMQDVTTFHIISNVIRKKNPDKWESLKNAIYETNDFRKVFWKILSNNQHVGHKLLKDVFPIHPYTAFISTRLAERIGSTERSIFNFLYDNSKGFIKFIQEFPNDEYFLTADYLWDFFFDDFERTTEDRIHSVLEKAKLLTKIQEKGNHYAVIFKGILLLNILYLDISSRNMQEQAYLPVEENIYAMFESTVYKKYVPEVLQYIDEQGYIQKTPDGFFLVTSSHLPHQEVIHEIEEARRNYEDITKIITQNDNHLKLIESYITGQVLRETVLKISPATINENDLERKLKTDFTKPHTLGIVLFLAKYDNEIVSVKNRIKQYFKKDNLSPKEKNTIFLISHKPLGEKDYNKLLEYIARAKVAERHKYDDDKNLYYSWQNNIIESWITHIKKNDIELIFQGNELKVTANTLSNQINDISREIFKYGPENIENLRKNENLWNKKISEKSVEQFLFSQTLDAIENFSKMILHNILVFILKDNKENIVTHNLEIKKDINQEHMIVKILNELNLEIKKSHGKEFNLTELLDFLRQPPFGLYPNMISAAILGFVMRKYVGKLYESGTGNKITKELMRDKLVTLLKYWDTGKDKEKLNVRLGSEEEIKLIQLLNELFFLSKEESLNKTIWAIGEWIKQSGYPIWSLKLLNDTKEFCIAIDSIIYLLKVVDKEINQDNIKKIYSIINQVKNELYKNLTKEKMREGFYLWLKKIENIEFNHEDVNDILLYLNQNMQEEIRLWDENKVESKVKDWHIQKGQSQKEKQFINLLSQIFDITNARTINELKLFIREKINTEFKLPLWLLNCTFNNEEIYKSISTIENFLKSEEQNYHHEVIEEYYKIIAINENILSKNIKSDVLRDCLKEWIKANKLNIDANSFYKHLSQNNLEKAYSLVEDDLKRYVDEYEFISSICSLFKFNEIYTLYDLTNKIKQWVNNQELPFWVYGIDDNSHLIETIKSCIITNNFPNNLVEAINIIRGGVDLDIFNKTKAQASFENWLKQDLGLRFVTDVAETTRRNMNFEDYYWNKEKVENWIRKNLSKMIPDSVKSEIKEKIKSSDKDFKEIVLQLIDKHSELYEWIEEYL